MTLIIASWLTADMMVFRYEDDLVEAIVETVKDYYDNECIKGHIVDSALSKMVSPPSNSPCT